jgi:hypothetical protein
MAGRGSFRAHPATIEEHAGRVEGRAQQLHSHADAIGGTSMSGNALGAIGGSLTGSMTSRYQAAGAAVHNAGNQMSTIASRERGNASTYRDVEDGNVARFNAIHRGSPPPTIRGAQDSTDTDPNTPPSSPGGGTTPQSSLQGVDRQGNRVSFSPGDVQSVPLHDSNGRLIGVSFPTKPTDSTNVPRWAGMNRTSDSQFSSATKPPPPQTPSGPAPSWSFQPPQTAPWATSGTPVYVHAHANQNIFAVNVNTGTAAAPNWTTVRIDGTTHGQVIEGNQYFQQAAGANPNSPLVMMSCNSARPGGSAASDAAAYLHGHGENRDIYAPTGTGVRRMDPSTNTSYYGVGETVDASGNPVPGSFQRFPAPPPPPQAPPTPAGSGSTP